MVYEFYPAFITPVHYTIDIEKGILFQNTKQFKIKGQIQGSNNLINEEYEIDQNVLNTFLRKIELAEIDSSFQLGSEAILDGITFRFSKINQWNDSISLISTSPNRKEKYLKVYKILDAFFELTDKTIIGNNKGQSITENIQDYFEYNSTIKRTGNKPTEYRVWGTVADCDNANGVIVALLDSLPQNKPVLFDLRNGAFATCLDELLQEYEQKKEIYYYGNRQINQLDLEIETLQDELIEAEKGNSNLLVGRIKIQLNELKKDRKRVISELSLKPHSFLKREDILKIIYKH